MLERASFRRVIEDKLRAEIISARGGDPPPLPPGPWPDDLPIGPDGLGADSLETMALAGAVNAMFHLHDAGIEDGLLVRRQFGAWVDLVQQSWQVNQSRISFHTSGSTGQPKRCTHRMANLLAEAADHAVRLQPRRLLVAVPAHHIYGFIFTVLVPLAAGCTVIDIRRCLPRPEDAGPGDVIVSFPDHWRFLARSLERLPPVTGVTSTAPMPPDLARDLRARGLARLVEVYGASETAGIGWRDDPGGPFSLLPHWSVAAAPTDAGVLLLGHGQRTAATPDAVVMAGARSFHVVRRLDGAIQIGGINVFPARIAAELERHPAVAQARVRVSAAERGGCLKALVVPQDPGADPAALRRDLDAWITQHLSAPERPRAITIARQIPTDALGKECDWDPAAASAGPRQPGPRCE